MDARRIVGPVIGCVIVVACARPSNPVPTSASTPAPSGSTAVVAGPPARPWADTTSGTPQTEIYRTWLRYIASSKGRYRAAAFTPSPYWLASEQQRWRVYGMALSYLPDGAASQVLSIEPDSEGDAPYRMVVRFTSGDENNALRSREVGDFRSAMEQLFGRPWQAIAEEWRRQALSFAPNNSEPHERN